MTPVIPLPCAATNPLGTRRCTLPKGHGGPHEGPVVAAGHWHTATVPKKEQTP